MQRIRHNTPAFLRRQADPVRALTKVCPAGEHTFRRVRHDEAPGEEVVFEMGPDGRAARIRWWSDYDPRVPRAPR